MSDLTDEEILATRRLHGLDDGLYKETKMKNIKVGDYIRTKDGIIGKSIKVLTNRVFLDNLGYAVLIKDIVKHDKNLIDLIEVGDYVNGKCVFATENRINDNGEKVILAENYDEWTDDGVISNRDIKTILTLELYETNCYKVGGE